MSTFAFATRRPFLTLGSAVVIVLVLAAAAPLIRHLSSTEAAAPGSVGVPEMATPMGITIQLTQEYYGPKPHGQGFVVANGPAQMPTPVYADANGMTLYKFSEGGPKRDSNCTDICIKLWAPVIASLTATPVDGWSFVVAPGGRRQWSFRGSALYTFAGDHMIGDVNGVGKGGAELASFDPTTFVRLPPGITTTDLPDAGGTVLSDHNGRTLYFYVGPPGTDTAACQRDGGPTCSGPWTPAAAPAIAPCVESFCVTRRGDGTAQWSFRGLNLYRFQGDLEPGYANGANLDAAFRPALLVRNYTPPDVSVRWSKMAGNVLTNRDGFTLYRRDTFLFQSFGFWSQHGHPPRPKIGLQIGLDGCDSECLKQWHPLKASAAAQPCGFWSIRADESGNRYWVYKGYVLYSYSGDETPGEMSGDGETDLILSEDPGVAAKTITPYLDLEAGGSSGALAWVHAVP